MLSLARKASLFTLLICSGCAGHGVERSAGSQFVNYGDTPLKHTIYLGSDAQDHYFAWSNGKTGGRWKIRKDELVIVNGFALGSGEALLVKDRQGYWCAYPCEEAHTPKQHLRPRR